MFNVSKKTLSLVLCLTLIASVVVFCFAGPASAVTNAIKYPVYTDAVSLAAKPAVELTFEGENRYGLPYHCGNDVSYNKEDFVTFTNSGGWAFIGNTGEALKNASDVDLGGTVNKTHADAAYVVDKYLYKVEANKTYNIVVDYKLLKGSVIISGRTISVKVDKTPSSPAEVANAVTSIIGNKVVWETNGVLQTGVTKSVKKDNTSEYVDVQVLETDTDLQTMTATITSTADGYIALRTHAGDGDNYAATVAIDSIKIYNLTDLGSSVQNPISFDNGGVDFGRYMGQYGYKTDDVDGNSNSYFWYDGTTDYEKDKNGVWIPNVGTTTGSVYFSNYEYVKTWNANINDSYSYTRMYKFSPGSSYEITFKFRIADPATYNLYDSRPEDLRKLKQNKDIDIGKTTITPCLAKLPAGNSSGVIDLTAKNISNYVKDLYYNGLAIENEPGSDIWQTVRICFTLNDEATIGAEGLYFGLRGGGFVTEIDDYNVRKLINYSVKTFDARNVSIDFENGATVESLGVTTAGASVTIKPDANSDNNYMKVTSAGNARISMNETRVLKRDKKYYISFDAKTDDGCDSFNFVMGNPGNGGENYASANFRIFFNDIKGALDTSGSKFYIDGQEVNGYANFTPNGEWRHYGFTLNLDSKTWNGKGSGDHTVGCNQWISLENGGGVYLLFGAGQTSGKSVCYDNIKISQFDEIKDAVPDEGEIKDYTQVSKRNPSGEGKDYISAGLRFKNCLPNDVVAAADEIGFVVIPSSMAVTAPDTWYKMDGTGSASAQTVVCKNATMNQMYERTASETYYQLVLTGLSTESGKTAYNRRFSAVLYVKNGDTYTYHALGETSYNQVGAIKDVINAQ